MKFLFSATSSLTHPFSLKMIKPSESMCEMYLFLCLFVIRTSKAGGLQMVSPLLQLPFTSVLAHTHAHTQAHKHTFNMRTHYFIWKWKFEHLLRVRFIKTSDFLIHNKCYIILCCLFCETLRLFIITISFSGPDPLPIIVILVTSISGRTLYLAWGASTTTSVNPLWELWLSRTFCFNGQQD